MVTLPAIPTLPPRTKLDLSQPTVKVPEVPEFTVPAMLSVGADTTAVTHPGDLTQGDWLATRTTGSRTPAP